MISVRLNSDLARVNVYVGSDGKIHYVNKDGADSALPFSSFFLEDEYDYSLLTYSTEGLTFDGVKHVNGGYCIQGDYCYVDITFTVTGNYAENKFGVGGFPLPKSRKGIGSYSQSLEPNEGTTAVLNTDGFCAPHMSNCYNQTFHYRFIYRLA